jgi:hypothetical protein
MLLSYSSHVANATPLEPILFYMMFFFYFRVIVKQLGKEEN